LACSVKANCALGHGIGRIRRDLRTPAPICAIKARFNWLFFAHCPTNGHRAGEAGCVQTERIVQIMPNQTIDSGIRDNHQRGLVADFLKAKIRDGSRLSVVSAYFTIYAYEALRDIKAP